MKTIPVTVTQEHIDRLAACKPIAAIAELIWNAADADATNVDVSVVPNGIGGIAYITVEDNGDGIPYDSSDSNFGPLGKSWKLTATHSRRKHRALHGKFGEGRFSIFALGTHAEWHTAYRSENGAIEEYTISADRSSAQPLITANAAGPSAETSSRTVVRISNVKKTANELLDASAVQAITECFALYMMKYTDFHISYNGISVNPEGAIEKQQSFEIDTILDDGNIVKAQLTVIEWKEWRSADSRSLALCDEDGLYYSELPPAIIAPGFQFTAYIKSAYIQQLAGDNSIELGELHPSISRLCTSARERLKGYFRKRKAERAAALVDKWKAEDVYPYQGVPASPVEAAERQVFDICAMNINNYIPRFDGQEHKAKALSFRLLKHAIEQSPGAVRQILGDVLGLPKEKQEEFAKLLQKTSLASIINAAKVVADRLEFIKGLELLVFDQDSRKHLKERKGLHRILAENAWVFGEEYHLSVDDQSLEEVLKKHEALMGRKSEKGKPVRREDGSKGIIDLMLSRRIPQPRQEKREHLVVELKRPSRSINQAAVNQIESYAWTVANDERFRDTHTRWIFWVISNEMDEVVRIKANQKDRASGIIQNADNYIIWAMTWAQVIENCRGRLEFFRQQLDYQATRDSGRIYLTDMHKKYVPESLHADDDSKDAEANESAIGTTKPQTTRTKRAKAAKGAVSDAEPLFRAAPPTLAHPRS